MGGRADFVRRRWKFPETVSGVDRGVRDTSGIFGRIGVSEVVCSIRIQWEIGGEEWGTERALGVVKEGGLSSWFN